MESGGFDAFTRHQVYVEGYKNGETEASDSLMEEIAAAIVILAMRLKIERLSDLNKRQLNAFMRSVSERVKAIYGKQVTVTLDNIKAFMGADLRTMGRLFDLYGTKPPGDGVINRDRLWTTILNAPVAGVGVEAKTIFAETGIIASILQAIRMAAADNLLISDFIRSIVGTKALNGKDGLLHRLKRKFNTSIETLIQHVTTEVQFRLGAIQSSHYVWCSILDSRTTAICRSRNGIAYRYGEGPRPPAHWNCRSFTIPATIVTAEDIPTFYTWVKRQPAGVQDDVLGPARGREIRDGKIGSKDLPGFDRARPLTAKQYGDSLPKIIGDVA